MKDPQKPAKKADPDLERRALLIGGASLGLSALGACQSGPVPAAPVPASSAGAVPAPAASTAAERESAVLELLELGAPPWTTFDPFLFCVHHRDDYPAGNATLGPAAALGGRTIGEDFANKDGWNMYHGDVVPGFPRHPHRGFETVTVTRRGYVDHSDSLGATARYGDGDVQWMTAGSGIEHAEMFPLLDEKAKNPAELFQIWLNLPARSKFARPHFSMFWKSQVPRLTLADAGGRETLLTLVAGSFRGAHPPAPPPDSWAAQPDASVAIWSLVLAPGARFELPRTAAGVDRTLYVFEGAGVRIGTTRVRPTTAVRLRQGIAVELEGGTAPSELLLLQGRPIGEPVVKYGPFVMNRRVEIEQAIRDYREARFGGWPWRADGPVHARDSGRFAVHADGRREQAT
jgi:redox-sensitive bicupin YhaK (pirin superfamily)